MRVGGRLSDAGEKSVVDFAAGRRDDAFEEVERASRELVTEGRLLVFLRRESAGDRPRIRRFLARQLFELLIFRGDFFLEIRAVLE